ncbi:hypothetical protein HDE_14353 [Halotydeus destructor]|nr:hypothetical protein HDE_14353 [Halotydeus destructor]
MSLNEKKKKGFAKWFKRRSKYSLNRSSGSDPELFEFSASTSTSPVPWSSSSSREVLTSHLTMKLTELEIVVGNLRLENEKLRHQVSELEDEASEMSNSENQLRVQQERQSVSMERQLSELRRQLDTVQAKLAETETVRDHLEEEIRTVHKEKREFEFSLKEISSKAQAAEVRSRTEIELQEHLTNKVKKMWILKEKETGERKMLQNLLKSAESFAKSQEEVIFELLYKIKELKRELIDKDVELAGLRQRCISLDRLDMTVTVGCDDDDDVDIDVSFDYNRNELSFDELDLAIESPFSPEVSSTTRKGSKRLSWTTSPSRSALIESCLDSGFADGIGSFGGTPRTSKVSTNRSSVLMTKSVKPEPSSPSSRPPRSLFELFTSIIRDSTTFGFLLLFKLIAILIFVTKLPFNVTMKVINAIGSAAGLASKDEGISSRDVRRFKGRKAF